MLTGLLEALVKVRDVKEKEKAFWNLERVSMDWMIVNALVKELKKENKIYVKCRDL